MSATSIKKQAGKRAKSSETAPVQFGVPSEAELAVEPSMQAADIAASTLAVPSIIETAAVEIPAVPHHFVKETTMTDTITTSNETATAAFDTAETTAKTAQDFTAKGAAMFADMNERAKGVLERGPKVVEELVEFSKGNVEALMASGRVAAKGAEEIARYTAEYARTAMEKGSATARELAAVKSPTEFFQLQGRVAREALDATVAEGAKFTENYLKLLGEVTQPIQNRYALAADRIKTAVAA